MSLKCLNIEEFLKPESAKVSRLGAAAVGVITPNQTINVMTGNNGRGMHTDARAFILNNIYDFNGIDNIDVINETLNSIVTLRYNNLMVKGELTRFVTIEIPKSISWYQYETLCCLSKEFDEIRKMCDFMVFAQIDEYDYDADVDSNNLRALLPELARRVKYCEMSAQEKLATIDENDTLTIKDVRVKSI